MQTLKKRIIAIVVATVMCLTTGVTAFADSSQSTDEITYYNLEIGSEGIVSCTDENGEYVSPTVARSTISGYAKATLNKMDDSVTVGVDASGYGGMGITVKTSSSWQGNLTMNVLQLYYADADIVLENQTISSNGEKYYENLWHWSPREVMFLFHGVPENETVNIEIWIYG